jgi:hypothetical protein
MARSVRIEWRPGNFGTIVAFTSQKAADSHVFVSLLYYLSMLLRPSRYFDAEAGEST